MIYVTADLHIDAAIRRNEVKLTDDGYNAFRRIVDRVIRDSKDYQGPHHLFIAGDISEASRISGSTIACLIECFQKLTGNDINVHCIRGNHDIDKGIAIAAALGVHCMTGEIESIVSESERWTVCGFDYAAADHLKANLEKLKTSSIDLLVLHSPFKHMLSFEGAWQISLDDLPFNGSSPALVVAGDIHRSGTTAMSNGGCFLSPGSSHATDLDEVAVHGVWRVQKSALPEMLPITSRPVLFIPVMNEEALEVVVTSVNNVSSDAVDKPLLILSFSPEKWEIVERIRTEVFGKCVVIEKKSAVLVDAPSGPAEVVEIGEKPEDFLQYCVNRDTEPELFTFLHLFLTDSTGDLLRARREEALKPVAVEGAAK